MEQFRRNYESCQVDINELFDMIKGPEILKYLHNPHTPRPTIAMRLLCRYYSCQWLKDEESIGPREFEYLLNNLACIINNNFYIYIWFEDSSNKLFECFYQMCMKTKRYALCYNTIFQSQHPDRIIYLKKITNICSATDIREIINTCPEDYIIISKGKLKELIDICAQEEYKPGGLEYQAALARFDNEKMILDHKGVSSSSNGSFPSGMAKVAEDSANVI